MLKKHKCSLELKLFNWIKDLAVSSYLLLTFMHTCITYSAMMLVFWQSLCSPLCVLVSTCFKLSGFFSASRAEPCIFHTLTSWGEKTVPRETEHWKEDWVCSSSSRSHKYGWANYPHAFAPAPPAAFSQFYRKVKSVISRNFTLLLTDIKQEMQVDGVHVEYIFRI